MSDISGTAGNDILVGTSEDDRIQGLDGNDRLTGGIGIDRLEGGAGDDIYVVDDDGDVVVEAPGEGIDEVRSLVWRYTLPDNVETLTGTDARGQGLYGNALDNVITGFTGWDGIEDSAGGDDRLYGGDGSDGIAAFRYDHHEASNLLLDGGAGPDVLTYFGSRYVDTVRLNGGADDDHISIFRGGAVTIDAGAGADRIGLNFLGAQVVITLGSGADWLIIQPELGFGIDGGSIRITDFETGDGGDRFVIEHYLMSVLPGWDPATNIFGTGFVELVQDGADTVFRLDKDGPAGPGGFADLVRFENRLAADFTQFNLGGYSPDGSPPVGVTKIGGSGDDVIWGTAGDDVLIGLEGHDELIGGAGDDRLDGGDGWNKLDGQSGTDRLFGGKDHDILADDKDGDDQLFGGGEWDDILVSRKGSAPASTVLLDGGDGGDRMFLSLLGRGGDTATVLGGAGNDDIVVTGRGNITVDGGSGDDHIDINFSSGLYTVTLGAGYDQLYLGRFADSDPGGPDLYDARIVVTDFAPGELGPVTDVLFFRDYLKAVLPGWDGLSDPFAAGWLKLLQDGRDAVIRLDVDGASGDGAGREFIRLKNVDAGALTAYNLNALAALTIEGTESAETVMAGDGDHRLDGHGGNDRLGGGAGDDVLRGGDGNDMLFSGTGLDQLDGGTGNDVFLFGGALTSADRIDGGTGTDQIALQGDYAGAEALVLGANMVSVENIALLPGNDTRFGDPGTNFYGYEFITTNEAAAAGVQLVVDANRLRVGEDFTFDGSAETDGSFFIYGGLGTDTLTGGARNDVFIFGGQGQWGASDVVTGGAGIDQLALRGNYTIVFGAGQLIGVEQIAMVSAQDTRYGALGSSYSYNLTVVDANVDGIQMTIDAAPLRPGETLTFDGSAEDDGSFRVFAGRGNDTIVGSQNGDILQGNLGLDVLTGGGGADTFRYFAGDSVTGSADHILDFTPGADRIDLGRIDADTNVDGNQAFRWIGSNAFGSSGTPAGELRAYESNGSWFVEGDTDGDGAADLVIQLSLAGPVPLGADSFLL